MRRLQLHSQLSGARPNPPVGSQAKAKAAESKRAGGLMGGGAFDALLDGGARDSPPPPPEEQFPTSRGLVRR